MVITRSEIEHIVGPIDDHLAAEIAATQASAEELTKAMAWLNADEARINEGDSLPTGKVAELIGILETTDAEDDMAAPAAPPGDDWV